MENGSIVREYEKDSLRTIGNDEFHKRGLRCLYLFQNHRNTLPVTQWQHKD